MEKTIDTLSALEAVQMLQEIGETARAMEIMEVNSEKNLASIRWPFNVSVEPWEYGQYAYGFFRHEAGNELDISDARNIDADVSLKNVPVSVSLDYLRVFDYPGRGQHEILVKFSARNFLNGAEDAVSFTQLYRVAENDSAPLAGYPIFLGLRLGGEVMTLDCEIVNVKNSNDEKLLNVLESDTFKSGLRLLNSVNPALPALTSYATGIAKMVGERNRNVPIPAPKMGLWFDNIPAHPKLAEGSYVAVQVPNDGNFNWNDWKYHRQSGNILSANGEGKKMPYNYFVFSISKQNV